MTDEKYDRVEQACSEVVAALGATTDDVTQQIPFTEMDPITQNHVRVQLAEIYARWEEQWLLEQNAGKRPLGKRKL